MAAYRGLSSSSMSQCRRPIRNRFEFVSELLGHQHYVQGGPLRPVEFGLNPFVEVPVWQCFLDRQQFTPDIDGGAAL